MGSSLLMPGKKLCTTKKEFNDLIHVEFNFTLCIDQCPIECDSIRYETSVSYLNFPTYNNFYAGVTSYPELFRDMFGEANVTYDMARKSVSGLHIFFDEIKYTEIVETESMKFVDLVAAIGGMMGLFLGFSIMIFVELIELVLQFFFTLTKSRFGSARVSFKNENI